MPCPAPLRDTCKRSSQRPLALKPSSGTSPPRSLTPEPHRSHLALYKRSHRYRRFNRNRRLPPQRLNTCSCRLHADQRCSIGMSGRSCDAQHMSSYCGCVAQFQYACMCMWIYADKIPRVGTSLCWHEGGKSCYMFIHCMWC